MKIRDILLGVLGVAWLAAIGVTLINTGKVAPEQWAILPTGIGLILTAFRAAPAEQQPDDAARPAEAAGGSTEGGQSA